MGTLTSATPWGATKEPMHPQGQKYRLLRFKKSPGRRFMVEGSFSNAIQPVSSPCALVKFYAGGTLKGTGRIQDSRQVVYLDTLTASSFVQLNIQGVWIGVSSAGDFNQGVSTGHKSREQLSRVSAMEAFLSRLNDLGRFRDDLAHRRAAIDESLRFFDSTIKEDLLLCDDALERVKVDKIAASVMVSILGITLPAKNRLVQREAFFQRVYAEVARLKGRKYAKDLLSKYQ